MKKKQAKILILGVFASLLFFSLGYIAGVSGYIIRGGNFPKVTINREVPTEKNLDFNLFWKVWDTVSAQYVDKSKVIPSEMVYGAIKGMVASLGDPYTVFLTPEENRVSQEDLSGNFDGVGIQIGFREGQLAVVAPLPNTPAQKAGVRAGDYIVEIKDEKKNITKSTSGMTLPEAVQMIRGTRGTKITLTLVREGESKPIVVDLVRETIEVPSVVLEEVENQPTIAHVKLLKFGGDTKKEWDKMVAELNKKPQVTKIILDLRNNPGGYLQSAVDIAADFLPAGSLVVTEDEGGNVKQEFKTTTAPRLGQYEVVLLTNKGSASASEILAGALRDKKNVKLIGDNTFGKGSVQEPQTLENGAGLHITIAKWLTPKGEWINDKGLAPDIAIEDNLDTKEDEQLLRAIETISAISQNR